MRYAGDDGRVRWTASAKWAEGPALDRRRDMPFARRLRGGLGVIWDTGAILLALRSEVVTTKAPDSSCALHLWCELLACPTG